MIMVMMVMMVMMRVMMVMMVMSPFTVGLNAHSSSNTR